MGKITFGNGSITFKGGTITFRNLGPLESPVITDIKIRPGGSNTIVDYKVTNNDTHSDAILFSLANKSTQWTSLSNKGTILKEGGTITTYDSNSPYGEAAVAYVHAYFEDPSGERENSNIVTTMKVVGSIIPPDLFNLTETSGSLFFSYFNSDPESVTFTFEAQKTTGSQWTSVGSTGVGASEGGNYSFSLPAANSSVKVRATATKTDRASASKESSSYDYYLGKVATPTLSNVYYTEEPTELWFSVKNNYQKTATLWARQKSIGPWNELGLISPGDIVRISIPGVWPGSFEIEAYIAIGSGPRRNSDIVSKTNQTDAPTVSHSTSVPGYKLNIQNSSSRTASLTVREDTTSGNIVIQTSVAPGATWTSGIRQPGTVYFISITGWGQSAYTTSYELPR